jgi:alpha-tubulin suppressor-like RCC1 family protein
MLKNGRDFSMSRTKHLLSAIIAVTFVSVLFLTCNKRNELFTPQSEGSFCHAFLCDTAITAVSQIGDTVHFRTIDTIHTADSITLVGVIDPWSDKITGSHWTVSDGTTRNDSIFRKIFSRGGVYRAVFTMEDLAGLTMSDTAVVCVNTPPNPVILCSPLNGTKGINPDVNRDLKWSCRDLDGDSLHYSVFFNTSKIFVSPVAMTSDTTTTIDETNLSKLITYYWMVKAVDKYGEVSVSDTFCFRTRDPDALTGSVEGYAFFKGRMKHNGIQVCAVDTTNLINPQFASTDTMGFFSIDGLPPKTYKIIAKDTLKNEYVSDTAYALVIVGDATVTDTLELKDPFKPLISNNLPTAIQTIRRPVVSAVFSDRGSGILVSSIKIFFNDSNITSAANVTSSGFQWTPPARLADGTYRVAISVKDSVGNASDTLKWTFVVDAMKLTLLPDTTVSIYDTVRLYTYVSDVFSGIKKYRWDYDGNGTWDDSMETSDTIVPRQHIYSSDGIRCLKVQAEDDSGMVKESSDTVTVLLDAPVANAGVNDTIPLGDTVFLKGKAVQLFGSVVKWEWKFETGPWNTTGGPDTFFIPTSEQSYACSLAVTDDDGNRAVDVILVCVYSTAIDVAAGNSFSLFLTSTGKLWACGQNKYGQLGTGDTINRPSPVKTMEDVQKIVAGPTWSFIIKNDGSLWGCGSGALGLGTTLQQTPAMIMSDVQDMAASQGDYAHSLILKKDNTLWSCGLNSFGQLGDGTQSFRPNPVQIMTNVKSIAAGRDHSLMLKTDSTLWACGGNSAGQLGDSTTTNRLWPVQIMNDVQSISAGYQCSFIIKTDGTLWACGNNGSGRLGDGTTTTRLRPVFVMADVKEVRSNSIMFGTSVSTLILKTDGTLWSCGNGTLGGGATPTLQMSDIKQVSIGGGMPSFHYLFIKTNGNIMACGFNDFGQLGDGTAINCTTPKLIILPSTP